MNDDELLKKYGMSGGGGGKAGKADTPATESASSEPSLASSLFHHAVDPQLDIAKGLTKGAAITAQDIGHLGSYVVPQSVSDFIYGHGGKQISDFANEDYKNWTEQAASYISQGGLMFAGPGELKLGSLALKGAERVAPKFMGKPLTKAAEKVGETEPMFRRAEMAGKERGQFVGGKGFGESFRQGGPPPKPGKWSNPATYVRGGGNLAELSARGAAGGAMGSPDDPLPGAAMGAALGPLAKGASLGAKTGIGQQLGRLAATEGAFYGLHELTGVPYYPVVGPLIVWHSSPIGKRLRRIGDKFVDQAGKVIGQVGPRASQAGGYAAGSGYSNLFNIAPQQHEQSNGKAPSFEDLLTEPIHGGEDSGTPQRRSEEHQR